MKSVNAMTFQGLRRSELMKEVVRAELCLNSLVVGIAGVVAQSNHTLIAVDAANNR